MDEEIAVLDAHHICGSMGPSRAEECPRDRINVVGLAVSGSG
jgi:hypothetical protein